MRSLRVAIFQNRTIGCNQDWNKLAEIATKISRTITRSQPMFGTFYEEPFIQEKVVKQRRKKTTNENVKSLRFYFNCGTSLTS